MHPSRTSRDRNDERIETFLLFDEQQLSTAVKTIEPCQQPFTHVPITTVVGICIYKPCIIYCCPQDEIYAEVGCDANGAKALMEAMDQPNFPTLFPNHGLGDSTLRESLTAFQPIVSGTI